ncbi:hypothetical protein KGF57_001648, partial [Candida theae]
MMYLFNLPNVLAYWYLIIPSVVLIHVLIIYIHSQIIMRKLGAKPFTNSVNGGFFGFGLGKRSVIAKANGKSPEFYQSIYDQSPHPQVPTVKSFMFGTPLVFTKDPENIKAILATQFHDFDIGNRIDFLGALLGKGIFTLDHQGWKDSRAMLRPQ